MNKNEFIEICNELGHHRKPFLFIADFELNHFHVLDPYLADQSGIFFETPFFSRGPEEPVFDLKPELIFDIFPYSYEKYLQSFEFVKQQIQHGNTFLLNLTFPTKLKTNFSLFDFYTRSKAKYKLFFRDQFVLFSPETFVEIKNNRIFSYPMKGTIDANIKNAEAILLANKKEQWEHNTIVDLIRNDLSIVAQDIQVRRYRYIDRIKTHKNELLQLSSEIEGTLAEDWRSHLGKILINLLPAGSVSGAPKRKTLEIIAEAEHEPRGYFTGVFGVFNGNELDSAVMIRFIEKTSEGLQFRSGGGITGHSTSDSEYHEMLNKVYVPVI